MKFFLVVLGVVCLWMCVVVVFVCVVSFRPVSASSLKPLAGV